MSESVRLTVQYEPGEDGFVIASIPEVPGAHSQGRDRAEARSNVIDALRTLLEARSQVIPEVRAGDSDSLELTIAD